jgi:hypothetical protein
MPAECKAAENPEHTLDATLENRGYVGTLQKRKWNPLPRERLA